MLNRVNEVDLNLSQMPGRRMNVLILDDSDVDRKRLVRLCAEAGLNFACTEVPTLDAMRGALRSQKFDIVFIDHLLVAENGLDAVKVLADDAEQTAVSIMIAGEGRIDVAVEAMRRGCSDYMLKSALSVESLQKSVATALERRILHLALNEERDQRRKFELAVRQYA
ncbi:MAG: response regulator, partial [Pseudomonadota bacterium]